MLEVVNNYDVVSYMNVCKKNIISENVRLKNNILISDKDLCLYNKDVEDKFLYSHFKILNNKFFKNIKFVEQDYLKGISLKNICIPTNSLHLIDWISPDKAREFKDNNKYGFITKSVTIPVLSDELGEVWMSPSLAEQNSMKININNATGKVLVVGLGIGYFPYMISLKKKVEDITIIEKNLLIIKYFNKFILPQFKFKDKIRIIEGDIFDYLNEDFFSKFDYTFIDIWKDNNDGFNIISRILENLNDNYKYNIDFWIEFSCYLNFRMGLFAYVYNILCNNLDSFLSKNTDNFTAKIHKYFKDSELIIDSSIQLKKLFYDVSLIRNILSTKL